MSDRKDDLRPPNGPGLGGECDPQPKADASDPVGVRTVRSISFPDLARVSEQRRSQAERPPGRPAELDAILQHQEKAGTARVLVVP